MNYAIIVSPSNPYMQRIRLRDCQYRKLQRVRIIYTLNLRKNITGVFLLLVKFLKSLAMHTFVGVCWLVIVPLIATRTHNIVFNGLFSSIFSSRFLALFSLDNAAIDIMRGWIIMSMFVCTFIALVWLREQVNVGGIAQAVPAPRENNRRVVPEGQQNEVEVIIGPQQEANNVENVIQNEAAADPLNEAGNEQMTWQRLLGLDGSFVFVNFQFAIRVIDKIYLFRITSNFVSRLSEKTLDLWKIFFGSLV